MRVCGKSGLVILAAAAGLGLRLGAGELDVRSMFGMDIYDSAEFSGSTETNAVVSRPGNVNFRLHPWRVFRASAGETRGSVLLTVCGTDSPRNGEEARRDYEEACSYFDSCTNLTARAGSPYNAEAGRYWIGTDRNGVVIAVTACLEWRFGMSGRSLVATVCVGEGAKALSGRTCFDPSFRRPFAELGNPGKGVVYRGVATRWKEDPSEAFRRGNFHALVGAASGFSNLTNICRYVRDGNGDERITCTYVNFDGHDHRLDILFPRADSGVRRAGFEATVTDLNFGEPRIDDRSGRAARERAAQRLAQMRREAGVRRMKSGVYDCVWGYSHEFNIFILSFDASGVGLASVGLFGCPFTWTADLEGHVVCELSAPADRHLQKPLERITVRLQYDPEKNAMRVSSPAESSGGGEVIRLPDAREPLAFMTKSSGVRERYDAVTNRFEQLRSRTRVRSVNAQGDAAAGR